MRDTSTLLQKAREAQAAGTGQAWWDGLTGEEQERLVQYVAETGSVIQEVVAQFVGAVQALVADVLDHLVGVLSNGNAEQ